MPKKGLKLPLDNTTPQVWSLWGEDFYRYDIRLKNDPNPRRQYDRLFGLERQLQANSHVYYAAPSFHEYATLLLHQLNGRVLAHSNFVRPSRLIGHNKWTYNKSGSAGQPNPDGTRIKCRTFDRLMREAKTMAPVKDLFEHLRYTASQLEIRTLVRKRIPDWLVPLRNSLSDKAKTQAVYDALMIAEEVSHSGARWLLMQP